MGVGCWVGHPALKRLLGLKFVDSKLDAVIHYVGFVSGDGVLCIKRMPLDLRPGKHCPVRIIHGWDLSE